jgi:EAL domain-containing protein (putative c-di-GMP-specific phosphodiesterase class I)
MQCHPGSNRLSLGCTEMQGFLFSPPRRIEEIFPLFARNGAAYAA